MSWEHKNLNRLKTGSVLASSNSSGAGSEGKLRRGHDGSGAGLGTIPAAGALLLEEASSDGSSLTVQIFLLCSFHELIPLFRPNLGSAHSPGGVLNVVGSEGLNTAVNLS